MALGSKMSERRYSALRIPAVVIAILLTATYIEVVNQHVQAQQNDTTTTKQTGNTSLANLTSGDLDRIQESINDARNSIHGNDTSGAGEELETATNELLRLSNETVA